MQDPLSGNTIRRDALLVVLLGTFFRVSFR